MRKFKFLTVILSLMVFFGSLTACNPGTSSQESSSSDSSSSHTCESVCPECGGCLDATCTEEACEDKCEGHTVTPPAHECESECPECGKCLDATCTEEACEDKCEGHAVTPPAHECESVCPECGGCLDATCTEEACADKCEGHTVTPPAHECESVCPECGGCLDATCTEEACEEKCEGHTVTPPAHTCESVCPTCNKCTDATCTDEACADKCSGTTEYSDYLNYALKGEKALYIGDSICAAYLDKETEINGWPDRIAQASGSTSTNNGVNSSVISNKKPDNRILAQYTKIKHQDFDYIIIQGGINDARNSVEIGTISDSFDVAYFDISTYAGGLEELFYNVTKYHSNAKLGYIFTFQTPMNIKGRVAEMQSYYDVAKQICAKWKVPFLNMYEDKALNEELKVDTKEYLSDYLHPNAAGYDILYKYIMYWMATLPVHSEIEEGYKFETMPTDLLPKVPAISCGGKWTDFY